MSLNLKPLEIDTSFLKKLSQIRKSLNAPHINYKKISLDKTDKKNINKDNIKAIAIKDKDDTSNP